MVLILQIAEERTPANQWRFEAAERQPFLADTLTTSCKDDSRLMEKTRSVLVVCHDSDIMAGAGIANFETVVSKERFRNF